MLSFLTAAIFLLGGSLWGGTAWAEAQERFHEISLYGDLNPGIEVPESSLEMGAYQGQHKIPPLEPCPWMGNTFQDLLDLNTHSKGLRSRAPPINSSTSLQT